MVPSSLVWGGVYAEWDIKRLCKLGWDRELDRRLQENAGAPGALLGLLRGMPGLAEMWGRSRMGESFWEEVGPAVLQPTVGVGGVGEGGM